MKSWFTALLLLISSYTYADQLAYIDKSDAERAVTKIANMRYVYLFCGCCSMEAPKKVKPIKVYTRFTNVETYWEVYIDYVNAKGDTITKSLDLAYVWKKGLFRYRTIGDLLDLNHDFCVKPKDWNNPENQETDI